MTAPWLVALDIDGTLMRENGVVSPDVILEVQRVRDAGHEVMLATGRSVSLTLPVLERFQLTPRYVVCSNGAITLGRDPDAPSGYSRVAVDSFDPSEVLATIRESLSDASYAVEDEEGFYRYTGSFPDLTLGAQSEKVAFEQLSRHQATRVVVISPEHAIEDFLSIVEKMGLHKVTYNVGWTAWLDIPRSRVIAVGDGRNDIDMLTWASESGRGVAMGQAPDEVLAAANEVTLTDLDDGVAVLFRSF